MSQRVKGVSSAKVQRKPGVFGEPQGRDSKWFGLTSQDESEGFLAEGRRIVWRWQ